MFSLPSPHDYINVHYHRRASFLFRALNNARKFLPLHRGTFLYGFYQYIFYFIWLHAALFFISAKFQI